MVYIKNIFRIQNKGWGKNERYKPKWIFKIYIFLHVSSNTSFCMTLSYHTPLLQIISPKYCTLSPNNLCLLFHNCIDFDVLVKKNHKIVKVTNIGTQMHSGVLVCFGNGTRLRLYKSWGQTDISSNPEQVLCKNCSEEKRKKRKLKYQSVVNCKQRRNNIRKYRPTFSVRRKSS